MNNLFWVVSLISVLLFTGCDKNDRVDNINNNVKEAITENQQQIDKV